MNSSELALSVILVAGSCRKRAQYCVSQIAAQSAAESIELVLVDTDPDSPALLVPPKLQAVCSKTDGTVLWSRARADAVGLARAPVVAFLEDHCFPDEYWAEALIEAHRESWAAVGYAFCNANPDTYMARASMFNDYAPWMQPVTRGETTVLPGQNISYKKELLVAFGPRLEKLLTPDYSLQQELFRQGERMLLEPKARIFHENFNSLSDLLQAHRAHGRLMGARRAELGRWPLMRRLFYGVAVLPGAPAIALANLLAGLSGRFTLLPQMLAGLPVWVLAHLSAALGESAGYLAGEGDAARTLHKLELAVERCR